jgi:hypothetical protein
MKICVDDFLKQGKTHPVCEDYVISGMNPMPHIILSDGCSSSPSTDTGARILAFLARKYLEKNRADPGQIEYDDLGDRVITVAKSMADRLGICRQSLDATLIVSFVFEGEARTFVYGDGFVVAIREGGEMELSGIDYEQNAPDYLSYRLDSPRQHVFREKVREKTVGNRLMSVDSPVIFRHSLKHYPVVLVASDGIASFTEQSGKRREPVFVAQQCARFKNTAGAFLKRRMKRAIREMEKEGTFHFDDISAGAFIRPE